MELPESMAAEMMVALERNGKPMRYSCIRYRSRIIATQEEKDTRTKVRRPAECRLLERSQPMMEVRMMTVTRRSRME